MSGAQFRKSKDPAGCSGGCAGIMMNIFDLNASMARTKQLTDRAHRDGSPTRMGRPDAKKTNESSSGHKDSKRKTSHLKNDNPSYKSSGTPVKMLMEQEMSKDREVKQKGPSVVARLMGLDDYLPAQQPVMNTSTRNPFEDYPIGSFNNAEQCDFLQVHRKEMNFMDAYEVQHQLSGTKIGDDLCRSNGSYVESQNEKRMALVRQKFLEAKRLATDQKFFQSNEFQDALEVLSSNKDLFLKFLEEPNSLFAKQIKDLTAISMQSQTRQITVLKPNIKAELRTERLLTKQHEKDDEWGPATNTHYQSSSLAHSKTQNFSHPTRIVVLKPAVKVRSTETQVIPTTGYNEMLMQNEFDGGSRDINVLGSRSTLKSITHQMHGSSADLWRDESLLSSVNSNGYCRDSNPFSRSDDEHIENSGSYSDSEIDSPATRHSWESVNKYSSPFLATDALFSRSSRSRSPESSVIREAKKRLSERWTLVVANGINQEEMHSLKNSSTLGEMLAIPELKKERCGENELLPSSCLSVGRAKDAGEDTSQRNLSRSKSVPISSKTYEKLDLNAEGTNSEVIKAAVSEELPKAKKPKSSLKGRFSSLFFSRSRKSDGEIANTVLSSDTDVQSDGGAASNVDNNVLPETVDTKMIQKYQEQGSESAEYQRNDSNFAENDSFLQKAVLSIDDATTSSNLSDKEMHGSCESLGYKLDQTSPTSVLDVVLEYDENEHALHSSETDSEQQNAVSRTLPVASVARTLSWEDDDLNVLSSKLQNPCKDLLKANYDLQEQFAWVERLLSAAGLEESCMTFTRWHSLDSPLDPMLLEKLVNLEEGEICREKRFSRKLMFDCANSAILEFSQNLFTACSCNRTTFKPKIHVGDASLNLLKDWFYVREMWASSGMNNVTVVVDRALKLEVEGHGWHRSTRLEVEDVYNEISDELWKYLVDETLAEFATA